MEIIITDKEELKKAEETERALAAQQLAQEITRLRNLAGWTQGELARRVGLHQTMISDIEKGKHSFPLDTVVRLARAFNENPFRFAAIYWGVKSYPFTEQERALFDSIISQVDTFLNPKTTLPPSYLAAAETIGQDLADKAKKEKIEPDNKETDETDEENTQKS